MKYNAKYKRYVSKDGLAFHIKDGKLVKCSDMYHNGYVKVYVNIDGIGKKRRFLHRMVYETFIGDIPEGYEIDHINNVKTDNRLSNLQLLTKADNLRKAHKGKIVSDETRKKMSEAKRRVKS